MAQFQCRSCGKVMSYGHGDADDIKAAIARNEHSKLFPMALNNTMCFDQWVCNQARGECWQCYSIIARDNYPVNIHDAAGRRQFCTVFSDMGTSVGDLCMNQVIRDEYRRRNPDESIVFLDGMVELAEIRKLQPVKIFWANLFTGGPAFVLRDAYWFVVTNEATEFARQGHYARLPERWVLKQQNDPRLDCIKPYRRYVVVHLRNQVGQSGKSEQKNIRPAFAYAILKLLQNRYKAGMFDAVVLVGNDSDADGLDVGTIESIIDDSLPILDLRNRWTGNDSLMLIAEICRGAVLTIGRDSGIIQLAGAADCPHIIAWDFVTPGWFPKVKPGSLAAWLDRESRLEVVLDAVKGVVG